MCQECNPPHYFAGSYCRKSYYGNDGYFSPAPSYGARPYWEPERSSTLAQMANHQRYLDQGRIN